MFYEEEVIDGVLCYRKSPNAVFEPFSVYELTEMLQRERLLLKYFTGTETQLKGS